MLQTRLKRLEGERKEKEAAEKEREAELVRLKLVVAEAGKVGHLAGLPFWGPASGFPRENRPHVPVRTLC